MILGPLVTPHRRNKFTGDVVQKATRERLSAVIVGVPRAQGPEPALDELAHFQAIRGERC